MTQRIRLKVDWGGNPVVGPGLSTFHFATTGTNVHVDVATFFNSIKANVPSGVTWTIPNFGDLIEDTTGALAGSWSETGGPATVLSTGTANFANGVGARVKWPTGGIHNGRRVVGSTFIVPILNGLYTSDGTLDNSFVATLQSAATALLAAQPGMVIMSRPKGGPNGGSSVVTSAVAVDKVSWLRSRRT